MFETIAEATLPSPDGTLDAESAAADAFQRMAKVENTRIAYRAAVRAWCTVRGRPALPGLGPDVAAFLAGEGQRGLTPNSIDLRRAAIRYLHRAAGCPVPTDDVYVAETVAGIRSDAARRGELPAKKAAATAGVLQDILALIPGDLRGLRDRALLLVGFAGALRRSELASIQIDHVNWSARGLRLTLPQTKASQADAVTVPLPYGQTALCPGRALMAWLEAAAITSGPAFRRIWVGPKEHSAVIAPPLPPGTFGPPAPQAAFLPRIGPDALTPWAIGEMVKVRAAAAGFSGAQFGELSLKRGALTTGMDEGEHPTHLRRLGRHKSFSMLGEYLELGDVFETHPLRRVL